MNNYYIEEYSFDCQNENERRKKQLKIAKECLLVANEANFPTDFTDVYNHLFDDENYIILFIKDANNIIKGFSILCNQIGYMECKILHVHGIVLSPEIQSLGYGKKLINYAVLKYKPDVVTAKTHNPRCFNLFKNINNGNNETFPNNMEIPSYVYEIAMSDKFINCVDESLIYRNAYPDIKIQQEIDDRNIATIFEHVGNYDAQAVIVIINNYFKSNIRKMIKK